jgi:glucan phosphoethanolaminetransferase (alkaline phosphatase superfamily)
LLAAVPGFDEEGKTQVRLVRNETGNVRQLWLPASTIACFAVMVLALPLLRWLHLLSWIACPFHTITGLPCPTCGYSRVFFLTLAGHAAQAVRFQPFIFLIFGFCGVAALAAAWSFWQRREFDLPKRAIGVFWMILGVSWAWNLCHGL